MWPGRHSTLYTIRDRIPSFLDISSRITEDHNPSPDPIEKWINNSAHIMPACIIFSWFKWLRVSSQILQTWAIASFIILMTPSSPAPPLWASILHVSLHAYILVYSLVSLPDFNYCACKIQKCGSVLLHAQSGCHAHSGRPPRPHRYRRPSHPQSTGQISLPWLTVRRLHKPYDTWIRVKRGQRSAVHGTA